MGSYKPTPRQSVRLTDFGLKTGLALIASGPTVLYTPASAAELVAVTFDYDGSDWIDLDGDQVVAVYQGTVSQTFGDIDAFLDAYSIWYPAGGQQIEDSFRSTAFSTGVALLRGKLRNSSPIRIGLFSVDGSSLFSYGPIKNPAVRQNTHAYAQFAQIKVAGVIYYATTAGTSAGSPPSFNAAPLATTTDGSVTWTSGGVLPTVGAAHFYALQAKV